MIDNKRQTSSRFSDDTIRRFLLGRLSAIEQSIFEERLFTSAELEARVRLAELDLADDYSGERLTRADRERVRQNFLVTNDRRQMVGASNALHACFSSISEPAIATRQSFRTWLDIGRPAWRYAFAALLLLLVFATVWRGIKEPHFVRQIIPKPVAPKPTATPAPQAANHPSTTSSPNHVEEFPALPSHAPMALSISVDSKSTAGNPTVVSLPSSDTGTMRFELSLGKKEGDSYRAELLTIKGELVFSADALTPTNDAKINFDVPARAVKSGDYEIKLSRSSNGSPEVVARYYFRGK